MSTKYDAEILHVMYIYIIYIHKMFDVKYSISYLYTILKIAKTIYAI